MRKISEQKKTKKQKPKTKKTNANRETLAAVPMRERTRYDWSLMNNIDHENTRSAAIDIGLRRNGSFLARLRVASLFLLIILIDHR